MNDPEYLFHRSKWIAWRAASWIAFLFACVSVVVTSLGVSDLSGGIIFCAVSSFTAGWMAHEADWHREMCRRWVPRGSD